MDVSGNGSAWPSASAQRLALVMSHDKIAFASDSIVI